MRSQAIGMRGLYDLYARPSPAEPSAQSGMRKWHGGEAAERSWAADITQLDDFALSRPEGQHALEPANACLLKM